MKYKTTTQSSLRALQKAGLAMTSLGVSLFRKQTSILLFKNSFFLKLTPMRLRVDDERKE